MFQQFVTIRNELVNRGP